MKVMLDDGAYMPERAHEADAGYDIKSPTGGYIPAHSSWNDSKDHWEPVIDEGERMTRLLQVQKDLASKIIFYGETEEKLSQLHVVDKALNS